VVGTSTCGAWGARRGMCGGGGTHHASLPTVGGGKGLWVRVLNGEEGVLVGGDNSRELLRVGKREGSERSGSHRSLGEEDGEMAALTAKVEGGGFWVKSGVDGGSLAPVRDGKQWGTRWRVMRAHQRGKRTLGRVSSNCTVRIADKT
jgi:hypothetical protein